MKAATRFAVVWTIHNPEATPVPSSGVAARSVENEAALGGCSALRVPDLDGGSAEQGPADQCQPTLGSPQIAAAVEYRPEQPEAPFVVVGLQRGGSPGIRSCKGLAEAEGLAAEEAARIAKMLAAAERRFA